MMVRTSGTPDPRETERPRVPKLSREDARSIGQVIAAALDRFVDNGHVPSLVNQPQGPAHTSAPNAAQPGPRPSSLPTGSDREELYQYFKRRLIDEAKLDPVLLHLLTVRPEIVIEVEPQVVALDGKSLKGRIARLMAASWFSDPRSTSAVRKELARTGADPGGGGTLSENLSAFVRDGFLIREGDGYQIAPGVKITEKTVST